MKTAWRVDRKAIGVYAIQHISTGKLYIGSSEKSIYNRISHHLVFLKRGNHSTAKLQRLWNEDGEEAFCIVVLEECSKEICREREQFWMTQNKDMLLNTSPTPNGAGRKNTPETIENLRRAAQERVKRPEYLAKLSARVKEQHQKKNFGQSVWTEETVDRMANTPVRPRGEW